nr:hypothetical protein [Mycobacterium sp. UM_NZ2]
MTTPSGPDGFDTTDRWPITGNDGSVSGLGNRTQEVVTAALKGQVKQSGGWKGATASVWDGLRRGSGGNPISLPLAILDFFGRTLLGTGTWNALTQLNTDVSLFFSGKWTALTNIGNDIVTLILEVGGTVITDVSDAIKAAQAKADEAADKFADLLDGLLGTGHGIADFVDWLQARRDETQATWDAFWQGIFGGSATGKNFLDMKSAAASLTSIATTAKANAESATLQLAALIDTVLGGGHAVSDLANYIINTWNGLVAGWNNLWDGVFGTSGTTGKTASDVKTAASSVASTANTANTNATGAASGVTAIVSGAGKATPTATGNFIADTWNGLVAGWNSFWDGIFGTSGSSGKTAADVKIAAGSVASTATTASTNAINAQNNNQALQDAIVQAGTDGTSTGNTADDVKTILSQWPSDHVSGPNQTGMTAYLTMSQTLDQIVSGLTATEAADTTPADAGAAASDINQRVTIAETLAKMAVNSAYAPRPWLSGGDVTAEASISVDSLSTVTRFNAGYAIATMICPIIGGPKDSIEICAVQRPTTLNSVYVALYQLYTDGKFHRIWVSPASIHSVWADNGTTVDNSTQVTMVNVSLPDAIPTQSGEVYYVELINKTATTMPLATKPFFFRSASWLLTPVFARGNAVAVTAPTVIDFTDTAIVNSSATFRASLRYSGGATPVYSTQGTPFTSSGTWTSPAWWRPGKDYIDIILVGGGGSGGVGTVGTGNAGGASSVALLGGSAFVTANGGAGGASGNTTAAGSTGKSPGTKKYQGIAVVGGDPSSVINRVASPGNAPGGGSSGSYAGGAYGYGGSAGIWATSTTSPATNYTDPDGIQRVRLSVTVGTGGAGKNSGLGWQSYAGGNGKVVIYARQNRDV